MLNILLLMYVSVPHPNIYIVINPIKLYLDFTTILWLNAFSLNLFRQVVSSLSTIVFIISLISEEN